MSIEEAEKLKRELTDKYVVVAENVPELRRFGGLTGTVKTVNMNCRALVEFDGPEDIGWYDINPDYLKVVDAPLPKKAAAAEPAKESPKAAAARPTGKQSGKSPLELARQQGAAGAAQRPDAPPKTKSALSPLERARQQGAAKSAGATESTQADKAPPKTGKADAKPAGKKLSPLELARQQGAAKSAGATESAHADKAPPKTDKADAKPAGKKLSPLELARQQGAFEGGDTAGTAASDGDEPEPQPAEVQADAPAQAKEQPKPAAKPDSGGRPKSIIEQARQQGPFKG